MPPTNVYPNNGVGCISQNNNETVVLNETGITLTTNLLTTPISVTLNQSGISTTNPNGIQFQSPIHMNGNNITNINTLSSTTGGYATQLAPTILSFANNNVGYIGYLTLVGSNTIGLDTQNGNSVIGDVNNNYNKTNILVNDAHREIDLNAVDILSNVGGSIYYSLPINFTMKWTGNYNYTNTNNWEMVQHTQMNLPVEYFTLTGSQTAWRYEFAINCYNCNNQTDKAYAMYLEFVDNNSNTFQSFSFNLNTPFTTHKNNSTYSATSTTIENYCYTDHIDFTGSSGGPFDVRLWRYGDNNYKCDFNAILTLSKTNLV